MTQKSNYGIYLYLIRPSIPQEVIFEHAHEDGSQKPSEEEDCDYGIEDREPADLVQILRSQCPFYIY